MKKDTTTPFWDAALSDDERIDWLLGQMTIDEKLDSLSGRGKDLERLGIPALGLGGEAAHGVEARNDQNGVGEPDITTSFPQPVGMCSSWDAPLMKEAGRVAGIEARAVAMRRGGIGLSRWAPTVDLLRDPRWGRNEEGYSEDPLLTGAMAGAYISGMRGDDPRYIRLGATLKHFYGNNNENGRGWKNSSIDPRNREELYLQPFIRSIKAGAIGVMTAYNRVNGTLGLFNGEVKKVLKNRYGLMHAVSDGGALAISVDLAHIYGIQAEALVRSMRAGVDSFSDTAPSVYEAAREAYELGLIDEELIDSALRNTWRVKLRLGLYDRGHASPFENEGDTPCEGSEDVCSKLTEESMVLLKNDGDFFPLDKGEADELAVIGPTGDVWYQDWYCGEPPRRATLLEGLRRLSGKGVEFDDGFDEIRLLVGGKGVRADDAGDGTLVLANAEEADSWAFMDWGEGNVAFKNLRTGRLLQSRFYERDTADRPESAGELAANRDDPFDWFVTTRFHLEDNGDGTVTLSNRFKHPVCERNGRLVALKDGEAPAVFKIETVSHGAERAARLAAGKKRVLLALGSCPMYCAKEEIDRKTIVLAPHQLKLIESVTAANPETGMVLFTNYPTAFESLEKRVKAILFSATGSQAMGDAAAGLIFGDSSPAGRLSQTWVASDSDLPDMYDYDIIRGGRTYRYFEKEPLFPFGFGLTYTKFKYNDLRLTAVDETRCRAEFIVENTGKYTSDEVVQIYGIAPPSRVKKPLRQLVGFERLRDIRQGEKRSVEIEFSASEMAFYDCISGAMMVEEGEYSFFVGGSSNDRRLEGTLRLAGGKTGVRDLINTRIRADHYDDCKNTELVEGAFGLTAAAVRKPDNSAEIAFKDCLLPEKLKAISLLLRSEERTEIEVFINGELCGSFTGDTSTGEPTDMRGTDALQDSDPRPTEWPAVNEWIDVEIKDRPRLKGRDELTVRWSGGARIMKIGAKEDEEEA